MTDLASIAGALDPTALKKLRDDFPPAVVGKLPRVTCKDCSDKRVTCQKHKKQECKTCGAWVSTAHIHLDYVGHAEVTDRLLSIDPAWSWEPVAWAADGAPLVRKDGNEWTMWIRLTVLGVTRLGVGSVSPNVFEAEKQLIGDALRNVAMRFGVGLSLWAKSEKLESALVDQERPERVPSEAGREGAGPGTGPTPSIGLADGERVLPEGWTSWDDCDAAHGALGAALREVPDVHRGPFRAFRDAHGWPMPYDRFCELEALLKDGEAGYT